MKPLILFLTCSLAGLIGQGQNPFHFTINTNQQVKPISPFIYGTNDDYPQAGAKRLGGNRITNYNWENNASNAGSDGQEFTSDYYVPGWQGVPYTQYDIPGSSLEYFHNKSLAIGARSVITLPMAGYVAADTKGVVLGNEQAPSSRWKQVLLHKGSALSLNPDSTDGTVYVDEELNFLISRFGKSNTATGVKGYELDNETTSWPYTHPYLWGPNPVTIDYQMKQSIAMANLIKDMDPTAQVFGPVAYGFNALLDFQNAPDWPAVKGSYSLFLQYYLARMKQEEVNNGRRLLDVLDFHWYPETDLTTGKNPFDGATDHQTNQFRMDIPRSLWDPSYVENTWIGKYYHNEILPLLPKVQQYVNTYYPGTKIAISEYSYGAEKHVSGGIAQADALGIFGKYDLYMANYWGGVNKYIKAGFDIYRNYDGSGSQFGDISVDAGTDRVDKSSVYASYESGDPIKLHVIAINKDQDSSHVATFTINSSTVYKGARVWAFDSSDYTIRQLNNVRSITGNIFQITLPPMTVYHFVLTQEDLSIYPYLDTLYINPKVGYSDGTASFTVTAKVSDGDNNISSVTVDLSSVGGSTTTPLVKSGSFYSVTYTIPAGTASGMKSFPFKVIDADNHTLQSIVSYQVIDRLPGKVLWDGDTKTYGLGELLYDDADTSKNKLIMQVNSTGGNIAPTSLYMHMEHEQNYWDILSWQFEPNSLKADDISKYKALRFYIRSTAGPHSDISVSIGDASPDLNGSNTINLKADGYVSSFDPYNYTLVDIPLSVLTDGNNLDLTKIWRIYFGTTTAKDGFDVWVDDIMAVPYSNPTFQPVISDSSAGPSAGYADGYTTVTVSAKVTDPDNDLKAVTVDLSPLGGPNNQTMTFSNGIYSTSWLIPNRVPKGVKNLNITAVDNGGNETKAPVSFIIYQKAQSDTIWNGDSVPYGETWASNSNTSCTKAPGGGNADPGALQMHLQSDGDGWSAGVLRWSETQYADDDNVRDLHDKRYLSFYIKIKGAPQNFDPLFFLKDVNDNSTNQVHLLGDHYLSSFTGEYQQVIIPLADLFTNSPVDPTQLSKFALLGENWLPANGLDVWVDDITIYGSTVADMTKSVQNAVCGSNGVVNITGITGGSGNYQYYINGQPNPAGATNPQFSDLAAGKYDIKVMGNNNFAYLEQVEVNGSSAVLANGAVGGNNIYLTVTGGSGQYSYQWSNGSNTKDQVNLPPGNYTVDIKDNNTGCTAGPMTFSVGGTPLSVTLTSFHLYQDDDSVRIRWSTASESNADKYIVEYSEEGHRFTSIGEVKAKGDAFGQASYQIKHLPLKDGWAYYRLTAVDREGQVKIYPPKAILLKSSRSLIRIRPNPASSEVILSNNKAFIRSIQVYDMGGRLVRSYKINSNDSEIHLNVQGLPSGIFTIKLERQDGYEGGLVFEKQ